MIRSLTTASLIAIAATAAMPAAAQTAPGAVSAPQAVAGTRLDIVATGEINRTPDVARIGAGVVTQAQTASEAIRANSAQMNKVLAALKRAGIAERDIQTSTISLNPEYRYGDNQPPVLTGYRASNQVDVRFRDIAETGKILDALVAEGANQINGPHLTIDKPEAAMDEARQQALKTAQARAETYARALGKRVVRILSISEEGAQAPQPVPVAMQSFRAESGGQAKIAPGEQTISTTLQVSFEIQ